jgi:hypothetical protein
MCLARGGRRALEDTQFTRGYVLDHCQRECLATSELVRLFGAFQTQKHPISDRSLAAPGLLLRPEQHFFKERDLCGISGKLLISPESFSS